jgi:hypothetical protein
MNNAQRKELLALITEIESVDLGNVTQVLADKFDNLSESLQQAERGQAIEAAADALQEALDLVEEAQSLLEQAIDAINTATE